MMNKRATKRGFGFLRPSWKKIIASVILAGICFVIFFVLWAAVLPGTNLSPNVSHSGDANMNYLKLVLFLFAIVLIGLLVISYVLVSLISYFKSGGYRDEE